MSAALHTLCPILLRRITPQHPWIDSRTLHQALAAQTSPWLSPLTRAEMALDALAQAFHRSVSLLAFYLKLSGDSWRAEKVAATTRSMVCCSWRSDNPLSTGAFRQVCIAVRRVLIRRLSQGQDWCPSLQFHTGGRGVRFPPGPALRGSTLSRIARPLRPRWCAHRSSNRPLHMHCSRIDCVLFAILSRRLLIFSSTDHDDLELSRHLRRDLYTFASAHFVRGRDRRDRERATRRYRACGRPGPGGSKT